VQNLPPAGSFRRGFALNLMIAFTVFAVVVSALVVIRWIRGTGCFLCLDTLHLVGTWAFLVTFWGWVRGWIRESDSSETK